ncbi:MAG: hypothetical protein P4M11_07425 [Candidatus Pacebacteria bacterium]|nr:hypothetical protein [Candidatus Paceibacterota bacterium]
MADKGQKKDQKALRTHEFGSRISDFVLDKVIFSNVFEKDIRRIYIYRKSERLAKALHLITPAFSSSPSFRDRLDGCAVGLIEGAILPPTQAREALSRELLALSSILSVARTGGLLSEMNADLIIHEAHLLLQEIASYEEPRLFLDDVPTLAELAKRAPDMREPSDTPSRREPSLASLRNLVSEPQREEQSVASERNHKGQLKGHESDRRTAILSILRAKGPSYIKDISTMIRDVSEKTIQRELQALVLDGTIRREGERRWSRYSIPS